MKSIRIGNDIRIEWPIVLSGDVSKLQDLDLTVEVRPSHKIVDIHNYADEIEHKDLQDTDSGNDEWPKYEKKGVTVMMNGGIECRPDIGNGKEHCRPRPPRPCPPRPHRPLPPAPVKLPYHIEDNTLIAMWTADRQFATGDYDIILYAHKNEGGQAVCDQYRFVRLVSHTAQADAPDDSGIEAVIAMQPVTLELSGLSAYEVAVINGFTGTEKEWLASLKKPAEDAAEQAKKDLEQFKTETKAEVKQDITNLNANTGVDEYEEFSSTKPYNAGDFVKYNGLIYKFAYAHQGAWTGTDVAQYSISKEIKELISENAVMSQKAISTLIGKDFTIFGFISKVDGTINNTQEPNKWKVTPHLKINRDYNIVFCGDSNNQYVNVLAYYDADKNYISGLSNIATSGEYELITVASQDIPENARYIRVCYIVERNNAFVSYVPFTESKLDIVIDVPRGKNLFKNLYASGDVTSLTDSNVYNFAWGIKRDRAQNKIKISESSTKYNFLLNFYDRDFQKLNSAIIELAVGKSVDIPTTCEYIVFSAYGRVIKNNDTFMLNYGEETLPYENYNSAIFEKYDDTDITEKVDNVATINSYDFGINGFLNSKGIPSTTDSDNEDKFRCTGLLKIDASGEIHYKGDSQNQYNNVLAFYNADKKLISLISNIDSEESEAQPHTILPADIPENTRYIRASKIKTDNTAYVKFVPFTENKSTFIVDVPKGNNIYNVVTSVADLVNSTQYQSNFAVLRNKDYDKFTVSVRKSNYYLQADFYDADWVKIGTENQILRGNTINIPNLCTYIVFSDFGNALINGNTMINYGEETLPYEEYESIYHLKQIKFNRFKEVTADTLTDGNISLDAPDVKWGQTISFWARVTTMGKITLSHGKTSSSAGIVDIDGTNITTYTSIPTQQEVVPHGLTIASFIEITLSQKEVGEQNIMLYIRTLNGSFERSIPFGGCKDDVMCEAQGCNLTECKLTFSCKDYNKDVWMFGDSYFNFIPSKLAVFGYTNALFDAYPGRNSKGALESLKKMIGVVGVPKIIYWALGMNDPDVENSANADWNNTYLELKEICSKYNVELVLATIPSVPNRNNVYKNNIVRSSGYRYVDNDKAVGGDLSSNWYSGLLGADQVHPTDEGAQVLAQRLMLELPEIKD